MLLGVLLGVLLLGLSLSFDMLPPVSRHNKGHTVARMPLALYLLFLL